MYLALVLIMGGVEIAPSEMTQIIGDRLARLDKLVVDLTYTLYTAPLAGSPLDRSAWRMHPPAFTDRLTIVRPNVLHEELIDVGPYVPTLSSVFEGVLTRRNVRASAKTGRTWWAINAKHIDVLRYQWCPILFPFEVHFPESLIPQLNTLRIFKEFPVAWARSVGPVHTYVATVPMGAWTQRYQLELTAHGAPLRIGAIITGQDAEEIAAWELYTLEMIEVNGAQLPKESVVALAVRTEQARAAGQTWYTLHHFRVDAVRVEPTLTAESVRLIPDRRNAVVNDGGERKVYFYDESGALIQTEEMGFPSVGPDSDLVPPGALRWRRWLPVAAGTVACATAVALFFVARRARR